MSELIAKTDSPVAVDENLTTLIYWLNIEQVSGFTIVVENAGGGSANDITDVQIDTSGNGGITSSLDQHDGVPAVPIASGDAKIGTFTETAAYIRVRAKCAAVADTTVKAILFTDTAVARICTLADVKGRLGLTGTESDSTISRIISGLTDLFESSCRRPLIVTAADVTEYYGCQGCRFLQLARYPVVSIGSIKIAYDYDFDSADAMVENTEYRLVKTGKAGIISRIYANWPVQSDCIRVIYRGGYCCAGQAPGEDESALPADLREAAIEQASFIFKRKDDIGLSATGFQGGSISKFSAIKLLPMVEEILKIYRRPPL